MASKVLVIDDHEDTRNLYSLILQSEGYECQTAHDGASALEVVEGGWKPTVVVCDLTLPGGMTGEELMRHLKTEAGLGDVKVVICSGRSELARIAQDLGASGFVRKPVDFETLVKTVRGVLNAS